MFTNTFLAWFIYLILSNGIIFRSEKQFSPGINYWTKVSPGLNQLFVLLNKYVDIVKPKNYEILEMSLKINKQGIS